MPAASNPSRPTAPNKPAAPLAPVPTPRPGPLPKAAPQEESEPEATSATVEELEANPDSQPAARPASLGQRLGTFGVILIAVAAGALAWLLSSFVPFKF